ncbi:FtsW/RodA/SpoVE family cell cycle protein [Roseospirillum parvum]|uniref:Probable peptidoglycan glycosyltransferase FtsW n=1 Tax=Roseospirillum parvum TaxID=83401 RepID=A0A1G7UDI8_9PROT|nr:putative peptidoglycan glycosyltransferase FtsW [Roseospirillum parvum]SDG44820.1 cell division protein FtsW [Roseospirillum parvum]
MTALSFARTDTSVLGHWWWTVDRWLLAALALLIGIGILLNLAAGPPAAERIGADTFHFVRRQMVFLPAAVALMLSVSLLGPVAVRRLAVLGLLGGIVLLLATLIIGSPINGANRWLRIGGFSLQASEFVKPCLAVTAAWLFARGRLEEGFPGRALAGGVFAVVALLLLAQPDVGMTMVVAAVWCAQFFLAGLPLALVFLLIVAGIATLVGAYFVFPHVASRIDRFLDPASGDSYQISRSMMAFQDGGLWGVGPGEGRIKGSLPDAHTDFIFAVAGEEFGLFLCLLMVGLFAFLVLRAIVRVWLSDNLFVLLAVGGLSVQFGLQALINMASSLHLMPTKGMTLPFVSYGGSSMLGLALGMGMVLALTRRRPSELPTARSTVPPAARPVSPLPPGGPR